MKISSLENIVATHSVKKSDIVIGIPSYNEADNIAFVVEQCNLGLRKYFPQYSSVIINADNNSPDGTRQAFLSAMNTIPKLYVSTPPGVKGKGNNILNLFQAAKHLSTKLIVVVDADIKSITPEWIRDLASPIIEQKFDYLTPLYSRNEYDGTITNHICYPLLLGLLGCDIRQPIGGDFALSAELYQRYLEQNWLEPTRQYGVDIFMTLHAILGGYKIGQVSLGAKIHKPSMPKLGPMFTQVVQTLFKTLLYHRDAWQNIKGTLSIPIFGRHQQATPQNLSIDYKSIKGKAKDEFTTHRDILGHTLNPQSFHKLQRMFCSDKLRIGVDIWSKVLYDLFYAYDLSGYNDRIIEALKSLYFARVASFIRQSLDLDHLESEQLIRRQGQYFFKKRNYLLQKFHIN